MKSAVWYQSSTFTKYYQKPIQSNMGDHILKAYNGNVQSLPAPYIFGFVQ